MIVPYDSPAALAECVRLLHGDRALLDGMSARARCRHIQQFSESRFEERLAATWSAAVGAGLAS